jgi:hypothetical protein
MIPSLVFAQTPCGADEYNKKFFDDDPVKYQQIEREMQDWIINNRLRKTDEPLLQNFTIPVVFHIVWHDTVQNLHDSIIHRQLEVLNRDFNLLNADTSILTDTLKFLPGNMGITFELANIDPNGDYSSGITRTYTEETHFSYGNDAVKFDSLGGKNAWPTNKWMNIWVCDLFGGLLGYSQFPGGSKITDGNAIDFAVVGNQMYPWTYGPNYAGGRVLVHEIGHWLNLRHPWGNGWGCQDDLVWDTGLQDGPTYPQAGCPDTSWSSCVPSEREIVKIYMDYCGDSCMVAFTNGQVERAHASLNLHRWEILGLPDPHVGIVEGRIQEQLDIKVFPTVTRGRIYIQMPNDVTISGVTQVLVTDIMGRVVEMEMIHQEKQITLFLYKHTNGTYNINLINNGYNIHSSKIIISKDSPYGGELNDDDLEKLLKDIKE